MTQKLKLIGSKKFDHLINSYAGLVSPPMSKSQYVESNLNGRK